MPPHGGEDRRRRVSLSGRNADAASPSADSDDAVGGTGGEDDTATPSAAGDQNPPQRRAAIRFALSSRTQHIQSLHDMDEDVRQALYYDEQENGDLLQDVVRNINAMRQQQQPRGAHNTNVDQQDNNGIGSNGNDAGDRADGEEEYCFRGLENMRNDSTMQMRHQARDQVIDDVLAEQERQRAGEDDGVASLNAERLAAVSWASSTSARNRAIVMGAVDEAAVRRNRATEERALLREQPQQGETIDANNADNSRQDEDDAGSNGEDTLRDILGAAGRMELGD